MIIYWLVFASTTLGAALINKQERNVIGADTPVYWYSLKKNVFLIFVPCIFFLGLRSGVGDTVAYIHNFEQLPSVFSFPELGDACFGYSLLQQACKSFLFQKPELWLLLILLLSIIPLTSTLSRYSINLPISVFVFFASTEFTYLINGSRQFLAVCICFFALKFILEEKPVLFFLFVLLAASVHATAIVMLPTYFIVRSEPWSPRIFILVIIVLLITLFSDRVFDIFNEKILSGSFYEHYGSAILNRAGVSIFRVAVQIVPLGISWVKRKQIESIPDRVFKVCINMSLINVACFAFAATMGGNLTGRVSEYFTVFNLLLYPYLFHYCFNDSNKKRVMTILFVLLFIFFFCYQMYFSWGGLEYKSEMLGIYF